MVIGGSHGKTTITSMILHAMQAAGKEFDYLVGAKLAGFETMVKLTHEAPVIIIEGDEYLASPIDRRPKFHLYKANIGVISGIAWDHINVFPTFENYTQQFSQFIDTIQPGGTLIYSSTDKVLSQVVVTTAAAVVKIPYQLPVFMIEDGITSLLFDGQHYPLLIFGEHNLLNLEAARLVCEQLGISNVDFYQYITTFTGAARRLELLGKNDTTSVFKDFAHSPSKLEATIKAVKTQYPQRQLVACIELHTFSSLNAAFLSEYAGAMDEAEIAIVFIDQKTFDQKKMTPYTGEEVKNAFKRANLLIFNAPLLLVQFIEEIGMANKNLLMMSSGNFGGIDLEQLTNRLL